jgi:hypothetical protein
MSITAVGTDINIGIDTTGCATFDGGVQADLVIFPRNVTSN